MKLSDYVINFLIENGLKDIFLLPGGGCMHLCDSVGRRPELNYICCLHEQACAFAAEAYGEYTIDFGCALVTTGPGGTNAVTGVACAWIESSPCVFISGQVKRADLIGSRGVRSMGPQEVDIVSVVKPITKYAVRLLAPEDVRYELEKVLYIARSGRKGPVWIDIPLDVQAAEIDPLTLRSFSPALSNEKRWDAELLKIAAALRKAKRPVIYVGNGIRAAGCEKAFARWAETLKIPVLLTWKAADLLPEECAFYIGRPGGIGQRAANFAQQKADWILVLGARLDLPSVAFDHTRFAPLAYKAVIDVDPAELGKFGGGFNSTINANLAEIFSDLQRSLAEVPASWSEWGSLCGGWRQRFPVVRPEYWEIQDSVNTYVLISALSELAVADDIIVPGSSGPCSDILMQTWKVKEGQRILNAPGLGAMGTGLPGAIGACIAGAKRRTINVNGDGGFQLNIQELETVRRLALPIKFFVLENGGYRSISAMQRNHFQGRLVASDGASGLTLPSTAKIAEAYGIKVFHLKSHVGLKERLREVLDGAGPALCVVISSPLEQTAPRATSEIRADGTVVSLPMEDMAPRLGREEFTRIMSE